MEAVNDIKKFIDEIDEQIIDESSIGIHGITYIDYDDLLKRAVYIMKDGLKTKHSIAYNVEFCGTSDDCDYRRLYNYGYCNNAGYIANTIINIPKVLEDSNGIKYFVGDFKIADRRNGYQKYDEDINEMWISNYVAESKVIPKEFIMGTYIYDQKKGKTNYILNPRFYGLKSDEEKHLFTDMLIKDVKSKIGENGIIAIDPNNIEKTYKDLLFIIETCKRFLQNTSYLEQAKEYIENNYDVSKQSGK